MARRCFYCNKGPLTGNKVSHSNRKSRTRWIPNLKKLKVLDKKTTRSVLVCTRCVRSGKVVRPPVRDTKAHQQPASA